MIVFIYAMMYARRNYDNVPLVASCEFVSNTVNIATVVVSKVGLVFCHLYIYLDNAVFFTCISSLKFTLINCLYLKLRFV